MALARAVFDMIDQDRDGLLSYNEVSARSAVWSVHSTRSYVSCRSRYKIRAGVDVFREWDYILER